MTANNRKLKIITLDIGGSEFQAQLTDWKITNDTDDAEIKYTFGGDDEAFAEEADASFKLELKFYSDWRSGGISDFLWAHDGETVTFQLDHLPDIVGEHVQWGGSVQIKAPSVGGEIRTTEVTEATLAIVGKPVYARIG